MVEAGVQFLVSALFIVVAGAALTRFADAIADRTRLGRLLVGSIFLAAATSLPELTVDLSAVWRRMPDLAVGDLVGSSLFNLLILAMIDLVHRSRGRMLSRLSAAHALSAMVSIALTALAGIGILTGTRLGHLALGGVSAWSLVILVAYLLGFRLIFLDQKLAAQQLTAKKPGSEPPIAAIPAGRLTLSRAILGFVVSAGVIVAAAPFLARSAGRLADLTGLGKTFVGTTLVAFSTSLPELVATVAAVRMGAFDLALGNIFGSNAFNMVLLVPLDLAQPGSLLASVSQTHAVTCLAVVLVTAVAVMGQLYHAEKRIRFLEPDAILIILLILGSLAVIYHLR
jgi:cation:H+ antiporter